MIECNIIAKFAYLMRCTYTLKQCVVISENRYSELAMLISENSLNDSVLNYSTPHRQAIHQAFFWVYLLRNPSSESESEMSIDFIARKF